MTIIKKINYLSFKFYINFKYMSKVKIISIIYAIGIIIGALFLDIWGAETTPLKTMSVFAWTVIFIITLFFVDRNERK